MPLWGCLQEIILVKWLSRHEKNTLFVCILKTEDKTRLKSKVFSLDILILLIWKNVPRTNVAQTNVVVTVVICCKCSKDPSFKI